MQVVTIVGVGAALCSTVSFVPQAWKVIRTAETKDISAAMYALTVVGFGLWTTYGAIHGDWPLIVTNSICLFLSGFILVMTMLPKRVREKLRTSSGK